MLKQSLKNCSLWVGPKLSKLMKNCFLWEGPHAGAGEDWGVLPLRRKVQQIWCVMNWPQPPMHMKLSLERREKWGKGSFMIWFKISLSYCDLTGNKIKKKPKTYFSSEVCFAHGGQPNKRSLPVLISTQELLIIFSLACQDKEEGNRAALASSKPQCMT